MNRLLVILTVVAASFVPSFVMAQTDTTTPPSNWKPYQQENAPHHYRAKYDEAPQHYFEVGGAISLGFDAGEFLVGGNPYVAYMITPWIDAGVVGNFQYYSINANASYALGYGGGTYHNTLVGGGVFARVFPIHWLFIQVQPEYNDIWWKQSLDGQTTSNGTYGETSFLVGGGLRFGAPGAKTWGFAAVLFDVGGSTLSPYNGPGGYILPVFRFGINVGL